MKTASKVEISDTDDDLSGLPIGVHILQPERFCKDELRRISRIMTAAILHERLMAQLRRGELYSARP